MRWAPLAARVVAVVAAVVAAVVTALPSLAETLVIDADRLHPVSGPPVSNGRVVVSEGRFLHVGAQSGIEAPPGARRLRAAVVTPGLIDAYTSVGLTGLWNVPDVLDQDETSAPNQAALRAIDAFNPDEPLLRYLLEHGVTVVQAGPGPASPIAGQAGIFRTAGKSADEMTVRFPSALVFNLGDVPKRTAAEAARFPATRMGTAALIRNALREGERGCGWLGRRCPGGRLQDGGAGRDVLARVARGKLPAIFTAHRADDLLTAVRLADEFELRYTIAGGSEAWMVADALADARARLLYGPVMQRVTAIENLNASYETPAVLAASGVPFAIRSGFESYVPRTRLVLFEAGVAAANGLGPAAALRAITLEAARLLGIEEEHGSIDVGKVADLVLFDGDPFEYTTHVVGVVAAGENVFEGRR